jgi:hypothetical protein
MFTAEFSQSTFLLKSLTYSSKTGRVCLANPLLVQQLVAVTRVLSFGWALTLFLGLLRGIVFLDLFELFGLFVLEVGCYV